MTPTLLADASPSAAFTGNAIFVACIVGGFVITVVTSILQLVFSARRQPPLAEAVAKEFARIESLKELRSEMDGAREKSSEEIIRLHERIDSLSRDFHQVNEASAVSRGTLMAQVSTLNESVVQLREWLHERLTPSR